MTRLYLPATLPALAGTLSSPEALPTRDDAVLAADASEEAEYDALMTAADLSAELLAGLPDGQRRRVVVVVSGAEGRPSSGPVAWRDVVAVHVDDRDDADPDDDLGWYATQEVAHLLG